MLAFTPACADRPADDEPANRAALESFHVGRGDFAYSVGETTNEFRGAVTYEGKFLMAWRIVGGEWMIGAYSISGNEGAE